MSASSTPEPHDRDDTLSAWEQPVLSRIEDDLSATDPRLARDEQRETQTDARLVAVVGSVRGAPDRHVDRSGGGQLARFTVRWAVLGVVTALFGLPCLMLAAIENNQLD